MKKYTLEFDFLFCDKLGKGLWYMKTLHNRTKKKSLTAVPAGPGGPGIPGCPGAPYTKYSEKRKEED